MKTSRYQIIKDIIKEENTNALFLEPEFDKALIGTCKRYGRNTVAAYNADTCLKILIKKHNYTEFEAFDKFHDTLNSTKKEANQPVFINDFRKIKIIELEQWNLTDTLDKLGTDSPS